MVAQFRHIGQGKERCCGDGDGGRGQCRKAEAGQQFQTMLCRNLLAAIHLIYKCTSTHRTIFQSSLEAPGGGTAVLPN